MWLHLKDFYFRRADEPYSKGFRCFFVTDNFFKKRTYFHFIKLWLKYTCTYYYYYYHHHHQLLYLSSSSSSYWNLNSIPYVGAYHALFFSLFPLSDIFKFPAQNIPQQNARRQLTFTVLANFAQSLTLYFIIMGQRKTSVCEARRGPQVGVADKVN